MIYIDRVASEQDAIVDQRNFKRFALVRSEGKYRREQHTIIFADDGVVTLSKDAPGEMMPTEEEAKALAAEFSRRDFPKSIVAPNILKLKKTKDKLFVLWDQTRTNIIMCQERVDHEDGGKHYLPWTFFDDGQWRPMEPDSHLLPLWKPPETRNKTKLMIHEGAKAAAFVDGLVNDITRKKELAAHPWAADLAEFEHRGWIGGAPNPYRTDWSEVMAENPSEVTIVADHDLVGERAIRSISQALKSLKAPVSVVMFSNAFKDGFDLADPFPECFWIEGRYRGPSLEALSRSATWATRETPSKKPSGPGRPAKPVYVARDVFLEEWVRSIKPPVFVNRKRPSRYLDTEQFNATIAPFSDIKSTADVLLAEIVTQVDSLAYEPGSNAGIIESDGLRLINMWTPTRISRRKSEKSEDARPWLEFMAHLFPIKADREVVLKWCATLIACPAIRMKYGLLLISETQGVGKGTLMEKVLAPLVGWQNVSVPSEKQLIESSFNSWIARRRLVIVHEIYAGHSKKAYDGLKSHVTDGTITINEKNTQEYEISNWAHFVLSSNSPLALRLVKGDRRWFVPKVTQEKQSPDYWVKFYEWLISGGLEIIHDWAYSCVAGNGSVSPAAEAPISAAKDELVKASRSEGMQMVLDLGEEAMNYKLVRVAHGGGPYVESKPFQIKRTTEVQPVVLTDRAVRTWLATTRKIKVDSPSLEGLLTIRGMLAQSGMTEVTEYKITGMRYMAFGNPAAMVEIEKLKLGFKGWRSTWV